MPQPPGHQDRANRERAYRERIERNRKIEQFFENAVINGADMLIKYKGREADIVIPKRVRSIGDGAFIGNKLLQTVTIPEGLWSIGSWAFAACTKLRAVTIPDSVTKIGRFAFQDCTALKTVELPFICEIACDAFPQTCTVTHRPPTASEGFDATQSSGFIMDPRGANTPPDAADISGTSGMTENSLPTDPRSEMPPAESPASTGDAAMMTITATASPTDRYAQRLEELLRQIEFNISCGDFEGNRFVKGADELMEKLLSELPDTLWSMNARVYWAMLKIEYRAECDDDLLVHFPQIARHASYKKARASAALSDPTTAARIKDLEDAFAEQQSRGIGSTVPPAPASSVSKEPSAHTVVLDSVGRMTAVLRREIDAQAARRNVAAALVRALVETQDVLRLNWTAQGFHIDNDGCFLAYTGTLDTVCIPRGVTVIKTKAFFLADVREVIIPDTVRRIEEQAFYSYHIKLARVPAKCHMDKQAFTLFCRITRY